jgi:hypothetical protein
MQQEPAVRVPQGTDEEDGKGGSTAARPAESHGRHRGAPSAVWERRSSVVDKGKNGWMVFEELAALVIICATIILLAKL